MVFRINGSGQNNSYKNKNTTNNEREKQPETIRLFGKIKVDFTKGSDPFISGDIIKNAKLDRAQRNMLIQNFDLNKDGNLDANEINNLIESSDNDLTAKDILNNIFDASDKRSMAYVSKKDFADANVDQELVDKMFDKYDWNKDGILDFEEIDKKGVKGLQRGLRQDIDSDYNDGYMNNGNFLFFRGNKKLGKRESKKYLKSIGYDVNKLQTNEDGREKLAAFLNVISNKQKDIKWVRKNQWIDDNNTFHSVTEIYKNGNNNEIEYINSNPNSKLKGQLLRKEYINNEGKRSVEMYWYDNNKLSVKNTVVQNNDNTLGSYKIEIYNSDGNIETHSYETDENTTLGISNDKKCLVINKENDTKFISIDPTNLHVGKLARHNYSNKQKNSIINEVYKYDDNNNNIRLIEKKEYLNSSPPKLEKITKESYNDNGKLEYTTTLENKNDIFINTKILADGTQEYIKYYDKDKKEISEEAAKKITNKDEDTKPYSNEIPTTKELHSYTVQNGESLTSVLKKQLFAMGITNPTKKQIEEAKVEFKKNNPNAVKRNKHGVEYLLVGAKVQLSGDGSKIIDKNNAKEQEKLYIAAITNKRKQK